MDTSVLAELKLYIFDSQIVVKYRLNQVGILPKCQKKEKTTIKKHRKSQKMKVNTLLVKYPQIISINQYRSRKNRFKMQLIR